MITSKLLRLLHEWPPFAHVRRKPSARGCLVRQPAGETERPPRSHVFPRQSPEHSSLSQVTSSSTFRIITALSPSSALEESSSSREIKPPPRKRARFVSALEFHDGRGLNLVPQRNTSHSSEQAKTMKYGI